MNRKSINAFLFLVLLLPALLFAQESIKNFSTSGIQKLNLSERTFYLNINGEYPTFHKIYNPKLNEMIDLPDPTVMTEAYLNAKAQYGLISKINIFVNIPFKWLNHYSPDIIQKNKGFGDIEFGATYQLLGSVLNETTSALQLSVIAPIGEHKNLTANQLPLGEGVWQFSGSFQGMIPTTSINFLYLINYTLRTNNSADVNLGDRVYGLVSVEKDLNTSFGNFTLESGFEVSNYLDSKVNGVDIANSSEFASRWFTGLSFYYTPQMRFSFTMPFTFYKRSGWFTDYSAILQIEYSLHLNN